MTRLRVACAQIECVQGDIETNLGTHLRAITDAVAAGVELVVFPELSLTDYLSEPDLAGLSRTVHSAEIQTIMDAARGIAVSFGFIEADRHGRCHNSQALVRNGKLLHVHRKLNLPTYGKLQEGEHYAKGDNLSLAEFGSWKAATLICADSWSPALPWLVALKGANLLIEPIASARGVVDGDFDNPGGWDINLRHSAMTYALPTVMTNHCGQRGGLDFWGGSRILDESGAELARAGETPALILADLDLAKITAARRNLPTVRDADPVFVHAELDSMLRDIAPATLRRVAE